MSIENARTKILGLQAELAEDLKDQPLVLLGINTKLNQILATLSFIGGFDLVNNKVIDFPPITSFMGEPLEFPQVVTEQALTPQEIDRQNLIRKIDVLEEGLEASTNEQILESYRLDQNVIRGLAKRAGLEDFKTAQLSADYIDQIRSGIIIRNADKNAATEFENSL